MIASWLRASEIHGLMHGNTKVRIRGKYALGARRIVLQEEYVHRIQQMCVTPPSISAIEEACRRLGDVPHSDADVVEVASVLHGWTRENVRAYPAKPKLRAKASKRIAGTGIEGPATGLKAARRAFGKKEPPGISDHGDWEND